MKLPKKPVDSIWTGLNGGLVRKDVDPPLLGSQPHNQIDAATLPPQAWH